jgi:hypothetical protein
MLCCGTAWRSSRIRHHHLRRKPKGGTSLDFPESRLRPWANTHKLN